MTELKTKPEIRFAGFNDNWQRRTLGDHSKLITKGTTPKGKSGKGKINFVKVENIVNGIINPVSKISVTEHETYLKRSKLDDGDILFSIAGTLGKTAIVKKSILPANTNQALAIIRGYDFHADFLLSSLSGQGITKYLQMNPTIGAQPNLSLAQIGSLVIETPNQGEQIKIGTLFNHLDHLITLRQREHDKTVNIKKAMLEKMFPKDGEDKPEIRFAGFTGAWQQRKLGELYSERNDRGSDSLKILSVSIHHGVSSDELDKDTLGKQVRRSEDKSLYKHVYFGDLVFNMMRAWQGAIGVVQAEGMVSPAYITAIPNEQVYPLFMDCCLRRDKIINQINNLSYGVTDFRKRLYWDSFINVVCDLPSVPEQVKITSFFTKLDHLITLHQRELAKLQNMKKALLEKMFV